MPRWKVYKIVLRGRRITQVVLGIVTAENAPHALQRAWARWPKQIDVSQVQAGFSVRKVKDA